MIRHYVTEIRPCARVHRPLCVLVCCLAEKYTGRP
jgi:hypothetical protein